ncbi:MAG: hypothetical protein UY28_C0044G0019 [Candidatus Amesbacteria bacterium GW2011_GWB1_48_13]|uniref:Uncharacterized protein n=3 Tax=Candidatus Amesiibacteriota TaxID=1752730 RepID=A0A0G1UNW4_9BACT|nr:MAG: hypothetical protein UY28_C0044G0019 [Candidatus Amesbacteria bacterium GW2011_GWB1_48_13]
MDDFSIMLSMETEILILRNLTAGAILNFSIERPDRKERILWTILYVLVSKDAFYSFIVGLATQDEKALLIGAGNLGLQAVGYLGIKGVSWAKDKVFENRREK